MEGEYRARESARGRARDNNDDDELPLDLRVLRITEDDVPLDLRVGPREFDPDEYRRIERERIAARRARMSAEERAAAGAADRAIRRERVANMSDEQRTVHLQNEARQHVVARRARVNRRASDLLRAGFNYDKDYDYSEHELIKIGEPSKVCRYCAARCFESEAAGICCAGGKVRVEPIVGPPEPFLELYSGNFPDSNHFLKNIRKYNGCFQMTSFGVRGNVVQDGWMPTFRVQGQIYHALGSIEPVNAEQPKFLQIYFAGENDEWRVNYRCGIYQGCRQSIVRAFQSMFDQHNLLIRSFRSALSQIRERREEQPDNDFRIVLRSDKTPAGEHPGRYNAPTVDEVAIVIVGEHHERRDIVIQRCDGRVQHISEFHPSYDALQYPLIFWRGQDTYQFDIERWNPTTIAWSTRKVTPMDYYAYQLMLRSNSQNFLLKCRSLLNQFVVDAYAKIESERLGFIRRNQQQLRADEYVHLRDAVRNDADIANTGHQVVILPSSFIGSPRHMHEYAQDAIAYVRLYGRPDLFITFTCNPNWPEIKDLLFPGQSASDRYDIVSRVFRQKLLKLIDVLTKYKLFGPMRCFMYSIEWQKRGLPHAHILLWLENRIRPDEIDRVISAELPDPEEDPELSEIIKRNMVHGPCGALDPSAPCTGDDRKCTKKFPWRYATETQSGDDGYPRYRRRKPEDGGHSFVVRGGRHEGFVVDNSWVVPHSPVLCKMFNAHINVEYCHSVKSIKYVCKYINKGSDMAAMSLCRNANDEVEQYQLGRYVSSSEAFWRIFGFPIHDRHPAVVHLAVHLENGQRVYYTVENAAQRAAEPPRTTLTEFFLLCRDDAFARTLLYTEVPTYYTWTKTNKAWSRRKRGAEVEGFEGRSADTIGRMYTVHPKNAECFYLRLLLTKVRGPTSFEHLKTVEGRVCATYREACQKLGLLESDGEWEQALREASAYHRAPQLRDLFAVILSTCSPSDPARLWDLFKCDLSEDILHRARTARGQDLDFSESIFNEALILIEDACLRMTGSRLSEFGLPTPTRERVDPINAEIARESSYDRNQLRRFLGENTPKMVADQKAAFDVIIDAIEWQRGGLFFIDAPGGTGKTFLLSLLLAFVREKGAIVLAVASSGIAATLLDGGRTAHSTFKLPLDIARSETPRCNIARGTARGELLRKCRAIVWDECTMAHKKSLQALDTTLRDLRANDKPFGGVVVVLAGDFRQTLPVIPRSTPADEVNACLKQSPLWRHVKKFCLSINMRVHLRGDRNAQAFADVLLSIGNGTFPIDPSTAMLSFRPDFCELVPDIDQLIAKVFPDITTNAGNHEWLRERAILAPKNDMVDAINKKIQDVFGDRQSRSYTSFDSTVDADQAVNFPCEFLNSLSPPGFPPHCLTLRVGSPIMLLRNLNAPKLCNGTRLVVKSLARNCIGATILTGPFSGEDVFIPRIPMISSDLMFEFKRVQFPVKLAYGMTINKSQGQSLKVVGLNLSEHCFSHGQLYVACSRVGSPSGLFVLAPNGKTRNIVYPQALI